MFHFLSSSGPFHSDTLFQCWDDQVALPEYCHLGNEWFGHTLRQKKVRVPCAEPDDLSLLQITTDKRRDESKERKKQDDNSVVLGPEHHDNGVLRHYRNG